tara:strand:+ start:2861 stop:3088 length:228 start_codon:yes stop_codon:yes gene_type:complete
MSIDNQIFEHYRKSKRRIKEAKDILVNNNYYVLNLEELSAIYKRYSESKTKPLTFNKWQKKVNETITTLDNYLCR